MSQFLAPRLHFGLAARRCKRNMYDQNLFDDEANISFHLEANKLFGHRREAGFMDKKMMLAFVFPLHFILPVLLALLDFSHSCSH